MLLYLAALKSLPRDVLEAASVDGAGAWRRLRRIRLPLLRHQTALIAVIATLTGLQTFTQIYILTNGGPQGATQTALYYVYQEAFGLGASGSIGAADAMAVLLFADLAAGDDRPAGHRQPRAAGAGRLMRLLAGGQDRHLLPGRPVAPWPCCSRCCGWSASALKTNGEIINPSAPLIPAAPAVVEPVEGVGVGAVRPVLPQHRDLQRLTTVGQIATGMLAGYAFAMFDFPAKRILFYLVLSGLMIPFTVVLVPVVQLLADVGWVNTYQGLIVPNLASALGCFLFRQFFLGTPAWSWPRRRGSTAPAEWRIFLRIYAPLAQPMTAAFTTIAFLQNWNNFLFPLVVTSSEKLMMISQGLTIFQGQLTKVLVQPADGRVADRRGAGADRGDVRAAPGRGRAHPRRDPLTRAAAAGSSRRAAGRPGRAGGTRR